MSTGKVIYSAFETEILCTTRATNKIGRFRNLKMLWLRSPKKVPELMFLHKHVWYILSDVYFQTFLKFYDTKRHHTRFC